MVVVKDLWEEIILYIYVPEMINLQKMKKKAKDRKYCDQIAIYPRESCSKKGDFRSKT